MRPALRDTSDVHPERLEPGQMWSLHKDGVTLTCVLQQRPDAGWDLKLELNGKLLRVDPCHNERKAATLIARWQYQAMRKGWTEPT